MEEADFETVPVAVVEKRRGTGFCKISGTGVAVGGTSDLGGGDDGERGQSGLEAKRGCRGFLCGSGDPAAGGQNGLPQSILTSLLESYENGKQTLAVVANRHPEGLERAVAGMKNHQESVEQVSLGGKTTNGNVQFFYALIAMACLYGAFIGFGAAMWLQADLNSLAARRSVTPTSNYTDSDGDELFLSAAFCECVPPDFFIFDLY